MWITKRTNSRGTRYVYNERYQDPKTLHTFTVSVTLNSRSRAAQKQAAGLLAQKAAKKGSIKPPEKTLAEVLNEWRESADLSVKYYTKLTHAAYVKRILNRVPNGLMFREFTPAVAEKVVTELYYTDNFARSSVTNTLAALKAAMRWAKKAGYISDVSAYEEIKLKAKPLTQEELAKKNNKFLSADELDEVLRQLAAKNERISFIAEFQVLTGLRGGELLALQWQDVDIEKRTLKVTGTMHNNFKRGTPKNEYSYREIDLPDRAVEILRWFETDNKKLKMWSRGRYIDSGYIFSNTSGRPLTIERYNYALRKVKIPGKGIITSHIFRHTATSFMIAQGLPLKTVMRRLGQNNPATTLKVYTHVTESMKAQEHEALEAISARISRK